MFIFENLEAYKRGLELTTGVYKLRRYIVDRIIRDQLFRAVLSIPLNIAEGQGRFHAREKRQFYNIAKGSLYECLPLIKLCLEIQYITKQQYEELYEKMNGVGRVLSGLIKSVKEEGI
ncbi:MAG: four helix bundle protein [Candidatus Margulisiibacteriota bacterium]